MQAWARILIFIFMLCPAAALSEIYSWVDDQGNRNYTTRLDSIPEPFRAKAEVLSLPASPPAPPELRSSEPKNVTINIPFAQGSAVRVSARINGAGPITLILDTGADRTLVSPSAFEKLGILFESASRVVLKGVTGVGYGDGIWVQSVEVGEARVGPLLIIVPDTDLKEADGLLGRDFLAHFNVTIDSKQGNVTLAPHY